MFRCDLLNRFFNETESRFGQEGAILPLFNLGLELVDPIFGGSMLKSHSLRCKFEYLGYSATPRLRILLPRGGVFEVGNQLMKKCHLAIPGKASYRLIDPLTPISALGSTTARQQPTAHKQKDRLAAASPKSDQVV